MTLNLTLLNNDLKKTWKQAAGLKILLPDLPGTTEENHKNPVSMPHVGAEIQTGKLANESLECYSLKQSALCGQSNKYLQVNQSRYRPGVAQRVPGI